MIEEILVSFKNVTVRNSNETIFQQLNFEIRRGEHWALIGSNESGNKSLLETIEGKYSITGGEVAYPCFEKYVKEYQLEDPLFTRQRLIAQVSLRHNFKNLSNTSTFYYQQRYNSFDADDALDVDTYLKNPKQPYIQGNWTLEKVTTTLALESLLNKRLITLSNGETKRVLLAVALLNNPKLLLLDNPMAGLDIDTRSTLNALLHRVAESGITIVTTCAPADVPSVITHVALFKNASIINQMPIADFSPLTVLPLYAPTLDEVELNALLSTGTAPTFTDMVNMKEVVIKYGDKTILDHINWQVRQGEHWALLGHNGAGKSTLLSLLNGDNPQAYANNIVLFDKKRGTGESIWDLKKKIGFLSPELFQYFPGDTSCLHVIESGFYDTIGLFRKSDPKKVAIAIRWMKLLEIENIGAKLFKHVSPSLQRLCLLARALVKNPPLLILDEPFQGFDQHQRDHFKNIINLICLKRETTVIFVSHYEDDIPSCIDKKLVLADGKVMEHK